MTQTLPVLPLRDIVVFPNMIVPLFVGRDKSVAALESAMAADKSIFLVAQLDPAEDDPDRDASSTTWVSIATVLQLLKLPDGTVRVLVEGQRRGRYARVVAQRAARISTGDVGPRSRQSRVIRRETETKALMRSVLEQFERYARAQQEDCRRTICRANLAEIDDAGSRLADAIAGNIAVKVADKQAMLVEDATRQRRLEMVFAFMEGELGVMQVEKKIRSRVKRQMEKSQREYYLNEQLKAIQRELGTSDGDEGGDEIAELTAEDRDSSSSRRKRARRPPPKLKKLRSRWRR